MDPCSSNLSCSRVNCIGIINTGKFNKIPTSARPLHPCLGSRFSHMLYCPSFIFPPNISHLLIAPFYSIHLKSVTIQPVYHIFSLYPFPVGPVNINSVSPTKYNSNSLFFMKLASGLSCPDRTKSNFFF